ncbi:MAG: c-type cytochrome domain-containing protein [Bryobacteraceae bacterium]
MTIRALGVAFLLAAAAPAQTPSFARDVAPVFAAKCTGCHASGVKLGSLVLDDYEAVMRGGAHGPIVVPGKSAESKLYLVITGQATPAMPMDGTQLAAGQIDAIKNWIDAGAPPPTAEEAAKLREGASRKAIVLTPKAAAGPQIYALAWHPQGRWLALGGYKDVRLADPKSGKPAISGNQAVVRQGHRRVLTTSSTRRTVYTGA